MEPSPNQRPGSSRSQQAHPARPLVIDLFHLYLGRNARRKSEDTVREPPNNTQKRVTAVNRDLPPPNEQFLSDFEHIQRQFPDQEQLRLVTESVFVSLVVQCSSHAPRAEFLLFALRNLCSVGYVNWDTFLPSLLSMVSSAELSLYQGSQPAANGASTSVTQSGIGSPAHSATEQTSSMAMSPVKFNENLSNPQFSTLKAVPSVRDSAISSLRQLCCKIVLTGLESNLKPVTHADVFQHMMTWLVNWDQRQQGNDSDVAKSWRPDKALIEWLHSCLDVVWLLVGEDKCRVPFYELLRSGLQFIENIPDDEALFTLRLEIHRRRDMMAMHMQMLGQHLHCPSFGTQRFLSQGTSSLGGEVMANLRYSPITYPSVLGEPSHGEDLATCIQKGTLDWDRAIRCLRHALHTAPSPEWWKRVLVVAPCYRPQPIIPTPGAVFTCEMICEATIDRIIELLNGCIDFIDFVDKLVARVIEADNHFLRTNHVTWLLAQIIRIELVMNALNTENRKMDLTKKLLSFHREEKTSDSNNPQSILLDFISSCQNLRIWSLNISTREYLNGEQLQKGRQINEWFKQAAKGEQKIDYMNLDHRSVGMVWVLSFTMGQQTCDMVMGWLQSAVTDVLPASGLQSNDRLMVMRETSPVPMSLLSGLAINLMYKLAFQMEDSLFTGQVVPSIAMVETYTRLLLIAPYSLFRSHFSHLYQRNPSTLSKPGATLLVLEILNYRFLPLYRYEGKNKSLMYDVSKILSALKAKRGDHRVFRLAENLCMNLILSLRDFFSVKKDAKGPTEFTETLNRVVVITLAIIIKTRGIAEAEHLLYLPTLLEQVMSNSKHTWSDKTLKYFPAVLCKILNGRTDNRSLAIQDWQKAEQTVINQCTQLFSPSTDPNYIRTYVIHSFPEHRQHLCAGAWVLMQAHPESINSANLASVLREFSPEEVTANIYTMVDVLLHHIQVELQRGHSLQDLLLKTTTNLAFFIWNHELLPLDIFLLALIDRDDDPHALHIVISLLDRQELQQRMKLFIINRGPPEHWLFSATFSRVDVQKALGNHLSWKFRYPVFFDDIAARLLPIIPLIVYRLIENDAFEQAERVLAMYKPLLAYYPFRFTFVRDILAYFYGHLPGKLIVRILNVLDVSKIPFSESFPQHIAASASASCPPPDYFATLLLGLVNIVTPPFSSSSRSGSISDSSLHSTRGPQNRTAAPTQIGYTGAAECQKAFYQIQDPGTYTQLVMETAVIELLSLPISASQIVSSLVQVVLHIQPTLIQSSSSMHGSSSGVGQMSALPTSPSGGSTDSMNASRSAPSVSGINSSSFVSRSGYSWQQLSCLLIQACGLLLAQLPQDFHTHLYTEVSRIIKDSWWLTDAKRSPGELDSAVNYALLDPTWAAQDYISTAIGNVVALLHSFFSNLPQEWLEGAHLIIKHLRPVSSVAMLRIAFRIMGPVLPRLANAHALFNKTLSLLLAILVDVFGKNSQPAVSVHASEITDLIDFLHHVIHYEGQGGPVQVNSKPRPEVLALFGMASENLRPDIQHLLSHLKTDANSSIYAATYPKFQNPV
ncbi:hypothetical protein V2J09_012726 [Rumex salicifolius]